MRRFASGPTWRGTFVLDSKDCGFANTADLLGTGLAASTSNTIKMGWSIAWGHKALLAMEVKGS